MNHPKLLPSQELVLHQVSIDSFSPATTSVLKFPTSPLLPRSPFFAASPTAATSPAVPSSPLSASGTLAAAPSIVRPQIRQRDEWVASLAEVDAFTLDSSGICGSSFERRDAVPVRYIADKFDRAWLSRRPVLAVRRDDGVVSMVRGKTGGVGGYLPVLSNLSTSVLEDTFTALELAAHAHPEVPLERLMLYARPFVGEAATGEEVLEELHAYWLLRRNATGGLLSAIPELRVAVREDNELALCHSAVLRDCPLPFKQRDWYVPVVERRRPAIKRARAEVPQACAVAHVQPSAMAACEAGAEKALRLSEAMLRREETRLTHTQLTLYELACLRGVQEDGQGSDDAVTGALPLSLLSRYVLTQSPQQTLAAGVRHATTPTGEQSA